MSIGDWPDWPDWPLDETGLKLASSVWKGLICLAKDIKPPS